MKRERTVVFFFGGGGGGGEGRQGRRSGEITRLPGLSLLLALPLTPRGHSWESNSEPSWGGTPYGDGPLDRICFLSSLS